MATVNSGRPFTRTFTATTTAQTFHPPVKTKFVQIRNEGSVAVRLFWDEADVGDLSRTLLLSAAGSAGDFLEAPVELFKGSDPVNETRGGITLQTASGSAAVTCLFIQEGV